MTLTKIIASAMLGITLLAGCSRSTSQPVERKIETTIVDVAKPEPCISDVHIGVVGYGKYRPGVTNPVVYCKDSDRTELACFTARYDETDFTTCYKIKE